MKQNARGVLSKRLRRGTIAVAASAILAASVVEAKPFVLAEDGLYVIRPPAVESIRQVMMMTPN